MAADRQSTAFDGDEEELQTGTPHSFSRRRLLVLVGAVVLAAVVAVAVVAASRGGSGSPQRAAPPTSRGATPSAPARPASTGAAVSLAAHCPAGATCSTALDLPVSTTSALRDVVPDAVVTSSATLLANRPRHFEPDLVARRIQALAWGGRLTVRIDPAPSGTLPLDTRVVHAAATATGASARGEVDGCVVTAVFSARPPLTSGRRRAAVRAVSALAIDPALTDAQ